MSSKPTTATYGTLPSTTTTTTSAAYSADSTSPYATFITRATTNTKTLISHLRPWREFLSLSSLSLPASYSDAMSRLRRNANYFRFNYTLISLLLVFLSLLWHPVSMIVFLALFLLWLLLFFSRTEPIVVIGRTVDDRIVLVVLSLVTVVALVLTRVGVNVLVSFGVAVVILGLHGVFRSIDELFLDEDDAVDSGLVSVVEGQPLRPTYARVV